MVDKSAEQCGDESVPAHSRSSAPSPGGTLKSRHTRSPSLTSELLVCSDQSVVSCCSSSNAAELDTSDCRSPNEPVPKSPHSLTGSSVDPRRSSSRDRSSTWLRPETVFLYETDKIAALFRGVTVSSLNTISSISDRRTSQPAAAAAAAGAPFDGVSQLCVSTVMCCSVCSLSFSTRGQQLAHFRSDQHRAAVSHQCQQLAVSSDKNVPKSYVGENIKVSGAARVPSQRGSVSAEEEDDVEVEEERKCQHHLRHSLLILENARGQLFTIHRCLLLGKKSAMGRTQLELAVKQLPTQLKVAIFLVSGGHFAAAIFNGGEIVVHKMFHAYTVRAGQGRCQAAKDGMGGSRCKSAGASLRRFNLASFKQHVEELMLSWQLQLSCCQLLFARVARGCAAAAALFGHGRGAAAGGGALSRKDARLRSIPFATGRPSHATVRQVHSRLMTVCVYGSGVVAADLMPLVLSSNKRRRPVPAGTCRSEEQQSASASVARAPPAGTRTAARRKSVRVTVHTDSREQQQQQQHQQEQQQQQEETEEEEEQDQEETEEEQQQQQEETEEEEEVKIDLPTSVYDLNGFLVECSSDGVQGTGEVAAAVTVTEARRRRRSLRQSSRRQQQQQQQQHSTPDSHTASADLPSLCPAQPAPSASTSASAPDTGGSELTEEMHKCLVACHTACRSGDSALLLARLSALTDRHTTGDVISQLPSDVISQLSSDVTAPVATGCPSDCCSLPEDELVATLRSDWRVTRLLRHQLTSDGRTLLHTAAAGGHRDLARLLMELGSDLTRRDRLGQTACDLSASRAVRDEFRRYRAAHPRQHDYAKAHVPQPLTPEADQEREARAAHRRQQQKLRRRQQQQQRATQQAERERAAEQQRREAEQKMRFLSLSDREKRALAAERRISELAAMTTGRRVILCRCFCCGADITGQVPFSYGQCVFCSTECVRKHRAQSSH